MTTQEFLLVRGMAVVTGVVRYPVLAVVSKVTLPDMMLSALKFIPPAVLTAIVVPGVLMRTEAGLDLSYTNAYLVAALTAALVAWWRSSLLLTIVTGMVTLWTWMLLMAL